MKAAFVILTMFAMAVPYLIPAADAAVAGIAFDTESSTAGGLALASGLLVWAILGLSLLRSARN